MSGAQSYPIKNKQTSTRQDIAALNRLLKMSDPPRKMCSGCLRTFLLDERNWYPVTIRHGAKVYRGWMTKCRACAAKATTERIQRRCAADPTYRAYLNARIRLYEPRYKERRKARNAAYCRTYRIKRKKEKFAAAMKGHHA